MRRLGFMGLEESFGKLRRSRSIWSKGLASVGSLEEESSVLSNSFEEKRRLLLIDGFPLLFRLFHGWRRGTSQEKVIMEGTIRSFESKVSDLVVCTEATHALIAFDGHGAWQSRQNEILNAQVDAELELQGILMDREHKFRKSLNTSFQKLEKGFAVYEKHVNEIPEELKQLMETARSMPDGGPIPRNKGLKRMHEQLVELEKESSTPIRKKEIVEKLSLRASQIEVLKAHASFDKSNEELAKTSKSLNEALSRIVKEVNKEVEITETEAKGYVQDGARDKELFSRIGNFPGYKENRKPPDPLFRMVYNNLKSQLNFPFIEPSGLEADDVIATLGCGEVSKRYFRNVDIVSVDKDFLQLLSDRVRLLQPKKSVQFPKTIQRNAKEKALAVAMKTYDLQEFSKEFPNLTPGQHIDVLALVGDSSDNVPGVKGIGKVTAPRLIREFGSIENLIHKCATDEELRSKKWAQSMREHAKSALLGKILVTVRCDLELDFNNEEHFDKWKVGF